MTEKGTNVPIVFIVFTRFTMLTEFIVFTRFILLMVFRKFTLFSAYLLDHAKQQDICMHTQIIKKRFLFHQLNKFMCFTPFSIGDKWLYICPFFGHQVI